LSRPIPVGGSTADAARYPPHRCCARNLRFAASANRGLRLRTFGWMKRFMHHNSHELAVARIIIPSAAVRPVAKSRGRRVLRPGHPALALIGQCWRCRALAAL